MGSPAQGCYWVILLLSVYALSHSTSGRELRPSFARAEAAELYTLQRTNGVAILDYGPPGPNNSHNPKHKHHLGSSAPVNGSGSSSPSVQPPAFNGPNPSP
ncbi:hypothetical protein GOP47_0016633 [Adiantum capillus-veneris]|uniref:Uncharacterized protein n=1 Tax=Adiantum capillus-veneris TaxID=13818 RepID=A0A9D4ZAH4_ADICA|nr:hypothetical protein GOP47_0016633 [Adiantum capillus-veneris]